MEATTIAVSIIGVLVSATGLIISLFVYRRTIVQEKQNLSLQITSNFLESVGKRQILFVELIAINKSKLPISLVNATLSISQHLDKSAPPKKINYKGAHNSALIYTFSKRHNGVETSVEQHFSDPLPINVDSLSTRSVTIALLTNDLHMDLNDGLNPKLVIETTGEPITVKSQELVQSVIDINQMLKESYLQ